MHRPTEVARWYQRLDPRCFMTRTSPYTGDEVRELLTSIAPRRPDRAERARSIAATPSEWLSYLDAQHRRIIGGLTDRLPSLVYFHSSGAGHLPPWRHEAALDIAYACIARRLNTAQS
jgi:hypothetical protein